MRFISYILSAALIFGGAAMHEDPTPFIWIVNTYPYEVMIGLSVVGLFLFNATNRWSDYKLSAESKETVIRGMTGKSIEDYRQA